MNKSKYLIILLLILFSLSVSTVKGALSLYEPTFTIETGIEGDFALIIDIPIQTGTQGFTLYFPSDTRFKSTNDDYLSEIVFYNISDVELYSVSWANAFKNVYGGNEYNDNLIYDITGINNVTYDIDLKQWSIKSYVTTGGTGGFDVEDVSYIQMVIALESSSYPTGLDTDMESNYEFIFYNSDPNNRFSYWFWIPPYYETVIAYVEKPVSDLKSILIQRYTGLYSLSPILDESSTSPYYGELLFFDSSYTVIGTMDLRDTEYILRSNSIIDRWYSNDNTNLESILINIPYDDTSIYTTGKDSDDIVYLAIVGVPSYDNYFHTLVYNFNTKILFNQNLVYLNFYDKGYIYQREVSYLDIANELVVPDPTPSSGAFEFYGWLNDDGSTFDFSKILSSNDYTSGENINIYSRYILANAIDNIANDPTATDDPNILSVLSGFGLNSTTEYTFLWGCLILLLTLLLLIFKVPNLGVVLVDIIITVMFHYLGLLPVMVLAMAYAVFTVAIMFIISGGGKTNYE